MISRKRLYAGLFLAGLIASQAQAGFGSDSVNIEIPEPIRRRAEHIMRWIQNNPRGSLVAGFGLIATPIALWATRRLWRQSIPTIMFPSEDDSDQDIKTTTKEKKKKRAKARIPKNNVAPTASTSKNPGTPLLKKEDSYDEDSYDKESQKPTTTSQGVQFDTSHSNKSHSPVTEPVSPVQPAGNNHPFAKTGFIDFINNGDYSLNFKEQPQVKEIIKDEVELEGTTTTTTTTQDDEKGKQHEDDEKLTDSWVFLKKTTYECNLVIPQNVKSTHKYVQLLCPISKCFMKPQEEKEDIELFKEYCRDFAIYVAHAKQTSVDVIFFDWDADLPSTTENASKDLAQLVRQRQRSQGIDEAQISVWSIADGNSCKLINKVSEKLNRLIQLGIHIASPGTTSLTTPHFETLYNFYSTDDTDQASSTWRATRKYPTGCAQSLHNVRLQLGGNGLKSGSDLRKALTPENLVGLIFDIDVHYQGCDDLDACCFNDHSYPLVALRTAPKIIPEPAVAYSALRNGRFFALYNRNMADKGTFLKKVDMWGRAAGRGIANQSMAAWQIAKGPLGRGAVVVGQTVKDQYQKVGDAVHPHWTGATEAVGRYWNTAGQELTDRKDEAVKKTAALIQFTGEAAPVFGRAAVDWTKEQAANTAHATWTATKNGISTAGEKVVVGTVTALDKVMQPRTPVKPVEQTEGTEMKEGLTFSDDEETSSEPEDMKVESSDDDTTSSEPEDMVLPEDTTSDNEDAVAPAPIAPAPAPQTWGQTLSNVLGKLRIW